MADLNYIRWFTVIVEVGSFTRAASRLGLTKGAVSKGITELEGRLGVRLLQRTTRQVTPTAAGRALYEGAAEAIQKLERAELEVSGRLRKPGGLLRVAAPITFTRVFLRVVIPRFLAAYPEVQLHVLLISGQYVNPLRVDADLLIQTGPLVDSTAQFVKLGSVPQGVFAARKFNNEHGPFERPEALQGLPGASLSGRPGPTTFEFTRDQERVRIDLMTRLIVPDPILHLDFAAAGLGISVAPVFLAKEVESEEKLVRLLPDWCPPDVPLFGLYPAGTGPMINVRSFLAVVRRYLTELNIQ